MIPLLAAALAQDYSFPTTPAYYGAFYPTAYFDHGNAVDWACGDITYAGHRGNDFGVGSWAGMDAGRDVVAAADGTVIYTHDGEYDRCSTGTCGGGGGFGNYVQIQHADGKQTYYAHLKQGSLRVSTGQVVTCGTTLGQAGSSGNSTGPHLHFEVRRNGSAADPYDGPCSAPPSWWVNQGSHGGVPALTCTAVQRCAPSADLTCGATVQARNDGGGATTAVTSYSCATYTYTGPERAWRLTPTRSEPVTLTLGGLGADLDLFVIDATDCDTARCVAASTQGNTAGESLTFQATAGHTYQVVVDGWEGAVSGFALTASCTPPSCHGALSNGHPDYCAPCACGAGEGDCDGDGQCASGLVCLLRGGPAYGFGPDVDVCAPAPSCHGGLYAGHPDYCAACGCGAGEGDCDADAECAPDLACVQDVGPAWGYAADVDVCAAPPACAPSGGIDPGGDAVGAVIVDADAAVSDRLCPRDEDWYAVDLAAGESLSAAAAWDPAEGALTLRLVDAAGATVASGSPLVWDAPGDGTWFVAVGMAVDVGAAAGLDYTLALDLTRHLRLTVTDPVRLGGPITFHVVGAPPGLPVALAWSPGPTGPGPCLAPFGGVCLGLPRARNLLLGQADDAGEVTWRLTVPRTAPTGTVSFQALAIDGADSALTPPVSVQVVP